MIRHIVLMTFVDETTTDQREAVVRGLAHLPTEIDGVRSFTFGVDAGLADGNADVGVVAEFDDEEAYVRYAEHPAHRLFLADCVRPILANRVAIQHEVTEGL